MFCEKKRDCWLRCVSIHAVCSVCFFCRQWTTWSHQRIPLLCSHPTTIDTYRSTAVICTISTSNECPLIEVKEGTMLNGWMFHSKCYRKRGQSRKYGIWWNGKIPFIGFDCYSSNVLYSVFSRSSRQLYDIYITTREWAEAMLCIWTRQLILFYQQHRAVNEPVWLCLRSDG